jgi:opacity protein-like surface antigen
MCRAQAIYIACLLITGGVIVRDMKRVLATALSVFVLAAVAFAADVTGTWNATVDLGGGQGGTPSFVLKQDGEKLTGTYSGALGESPVTGTIKGNDITIDFGAGGNNVHYAGKLDADGKTIKGTCDYAGQANGTFTATRAEAKNNDKGKK